jgi:hypothetical protein
MNNKLSILMSVVLGLTAGQLFAEGAGPLKVENSVKVGYSDNYYYRPNSTKEEKTFVRDVVDLSFLAALSDRTDFSLKSQLNLLSDSEGMDLYPNVYAILSHSFSERLLVRLSEYYRSGNNNGDGSSSRVEGVRYDFFQNRAGGSADYVLTEKDRLQASLNHDVYRNDRAINDLDTTKINGELTWKHELIAERTFASLNLRQRRVSYDHRTDNTSTNKVYLGDDAFYNQTELTAGLTHTFNPEWSGHVEGGVTRTQNKNSDYYTNGVPANLVAGNNSMSADPFLSAGLVYNPSPRTKLAADISMSRTESSASTDYTSQNDQTLTLSAEQGITGKLTAKASASFTKTKMNKDDAKISNEQDRNQDRTQVALGLSYQLNRINFIDLDMQHNQVVRDWTDDWKENRLEIGWRVVLN